MRKINWTNTSFLVITPILGLIGAVWLATQHAIHWQTVLLTVVYSFATGFAITAGYHRLYSHQTYQASWIVRLLYALFGMAAFEGSILEWCSDHRRHHRFVDTDKDPYNINQGFWYAHIGWLLVNQPSERNFANVSDIQADPIAVWQHRYNTIVALFMGIAVPILLCGLWSDWIGGFFIAAMLRVTLAQHLTFCINSVCHTFGKRTYSDKQTARDNWFTAFFTFGEGFHSFHHQFPADFRNGIRYFHYDPTKWLIFGLSKVSLAWNLKRVDLKQIISARINFYEKCLEKRSKSLNMAGYQQTFFEPARAKALAILMKLEKTSQTYRQFKQDANRFKNTYLRSYQLRQRIYRQYMKKQQRALSNAMAHFAQVIKKCPTATAS